MGCNMWHIVRNVIRPISSETVRKQVSHHTHCMGQGVLIPHLVNGLDLTHGSI